MRKYMLLFGFVSIFSFIIEQATQNAYSHIAGAVAGKTGSPADGQTCADGVGCHGGTATPLLNLITSDVPISGYAPDSTYTITATVSDPNKVRFGFEISPQDSAGNLLGILAITDAARTHFCSLSTKYITHSLVGSSAPNHTDIWSFNWTAPVAGTGCVTFWGAFNYANNNGAFTGDTIHTSTLTICEGATNINEPIVISSMNVYPNPLQDVLVLNYYLQKPERIIIGIFDDRGACIVTLLDGNQSEGAQRFSSNLAGKISSGIYLLQLKAGEQTMTRKIVKL